MTLPRVLSLDEHNNLKIEPIDELKVLRYDPIKIENLNVNEEVVWENIRGNSMELKLSINPRKAESMGIKVYASADGQEETVLTYYPSKNEFTLDFANSSLNK